MVKWTNISGKRNQMLKDEMYFQRRKRVNPEDTVRHNANRETAIQEDVGKRDVNKQSLPVFR